MVKNHYPELFKDDDRMRAKAEAMAGRTYELSQFLVNVLKVNEANLSGKGKITYHASCQLTRELGVREEPLLLLQSLNGAEFVHLPHADRCCGFGGIFMAKLPEVSMALADEKLDTILATGADTVAGCDHGCLMNIADASSGGAARAGQAHSSGAGGGSIMSSSTQSSHFDQCRTGLRNTTLRGAMRNATDTFTIKRRTRGGLPRGMAEEASAMRLH
jgi:hypothetical protein